MASPPRTAVILQLPAYINASFPGDGWQSLWKTLNYDLGLSFNFRSCTLLRSHAPRMMPRIGTDSEIHFSWTHSNESWRHLKCVIVATPLAEEKQPSKHTRLETAAPRGALKLTEDQLSHYSECRQLPQCTGGARFKKLSHFLTRSVKTMQHIFPSVTRIENRTNR